MTERRIAIRCTGLLVPYYFLVATGAMRAANPQTSPRQKTNINAFWKYREGDIRGAESPTFDDSLWQTVGLPHSLSIPYFMSPDFYNGDGASIALFQNPGIANMVRVRKYVRRSARPI
jgi:beta-galactosidase